MLACYRAYWTEDESSELIQNPKESLLGSLDLRGEGQDCRARDVRRGSREVLLRMVGFNFTGVLVDERSQLN
jgi:hypothetical protein